ncbi:septal ring lytic transglycosylase RlpA family protein [Desulfobacterota bacterium AH_259_B03_O07]|nr:septal ring lytic transglycosylase RlpA family protein [Desulfobacterota bacterium AH_259_B03_O07]
MNKRCLIIFLVLPFLFSCAIFSKKSVSRRQEIKSYPKEGTTQIGIASWYGIEEHGLPTATGERFSKDAFTAAHKSLPMGTIVRVTNLENGRDVIVKVNDRGPFVEGRMIDLSYAAAKSIAMIRKGTANVKVEIISAPGRSSDFFEPKYIVQVGSFRDKNKALNLKSDLLLRLNNEVRVEKIDIEGEKYYRVRIGRFSRREDAEKTSHSLKKFGYRGKVILE